MDEFVRKLENFNYCKDLVSFRLIGSITDIYQKFVCDNPLVLPVCDDLYLVPYLREGVDSGIVSTIINDKLINIWGISKDQLHELAFEGLKKDGFTFLPMDKMLEKMGINGVELDGIKMSVLTNSFGINGSAQIVNPDFLAYYRSLGGDERAVILPSSVHEIIFLEIFDDFEEGDINKIISEINCLLVSDREKLSNHMYFLDIFYTFLRPFFSFG